ncbi:MAG: ETC complex I subunit [Nitratireductor sp.]
MTARIYSPAKTAMQSGRAKTNGFVLEFEPASPRRIEPLMGYTTSSDTMQQVRLNFETLEQAVAYCEKHGIGYSVQLPHEQRRRRASYSDNFAFNRKQPWTH